MCRQEHREPVDSFLILLYQLAEYCNYRDLRDEIIQDRTVVGLTDSNLSERYQTDSELTHDKAITMARRTEVVREQQAVVRGETDRQTTLAQESRQWSIVTPTRSYELCSMSARFQSSQQERLH